MHWCSMFICHTLCSLCDMAVHLRILFIVTGLAGIHSITTVSKVSVKAGGSISIPCRYEPQYTGNVKYLCKGESWNSCSYAVKTNEQRSGQFSISDDKKQRIFSVTINNLTYQDAGYWCVVEINSGGDHGKYFHLLITRDTPALYVDHQEITGFVGGEITIKCYNRYPGEIKWCGLGGSCVTRSSGSIQVNRVTTDPSVFTVTMSGLKKESSGWYLCSQGDLQMPVHITVIDKPIDTTVAATTLLSTTPEPGNPTTGVADKETTTVQDEQQSDSIYLMSVIILLSLLIFSVLVTLFIWFMLRKCKQAKAAASALTTTSYTESDMDAMYSFVVFKKPKRVQKVEANDENVIYSTLA